MIYKIKHNDFVFKKWVIKGTCKHFRLSCLDLAKLIIFIITKIYPIAPHLIKSTMIFFRNHFDVLQYNPVHLTHCHFHSFVFFMLLFFYSCAITYSCHRFFSCFCKRLIIHHNLMSTCPLYQFLPSRIAQWKVARSIIKKTTTKARKVIQI